MRDSNGWDASNWDPKNWDPKNWDSKNWEWDGGDWSFQGEDGPGSRLQGEVSGGGKELRVRTERGDIHIEKD